MSDKIKSEFSSDTAPIEGQNSHPAIFPCIMLGTAGFLGSILYVINAEDLLSGLFSSPTNAIVFLKITGALSITAAHGHAMAMNGNARRTFDVPHPNTSNEVAYLNAGRGYYNMVEHLPFFLFNYYLAYEATPCLAGLASILFGLGRIKYTSDYAFRGPKARSGGFIIATMSSMALLGLAVCNSVLLPF